MKTLKTILTVTAVTVVTFPLAAQTLPRTNATSDPHNPISESALQVGAAAAEGTSSLFTKIATETSRQMFNLKKQQTQASANQTQATPAQDEQPAAPACPNCHEPYTVDEMCHGDTHYCAHPDKPMPAHVGICGYCGQPVTQEQAETIAHRHEPYNYTAEEIMSTNQGRVIYGPNQDQPQTFECPYCSQPMHQLEPVTTCGVCHKPLKDGEHVHHCQPATTATAEGSESETK